MPRSRSTSPITSAARRWSSSRGCCPRADVELYGKLEAYNPGGSVKDRIGVAMIDAAERDGRIEPGRTTIVEATCGQHGHRARLRVRRQGLRPDPHAPAGHEPRARGRCCASTARRCEIIESMGGMNEAVAPPGSCAAAPDVFLPDQFSNPANPETHRRTTAPRSWTRWTASVDVLVAGRGDGRHDHRRRRGAQGAHRRARVVAVEPRTSAVLSGRPPGPHKIQGIGAGFVPPILNRDVIDEILAGRRRGGDRDGAAVRAREGVLIGISCGAALWAALEIAGRPEAKGKRDRTDPPRLGRALRLHAVLRAGVAGRPAPGRRACRGTRPPSPATARSPRRR